MRIATPEQIREEIREYGVTKFAREFGFSRAYLTRVINGRRNLSKRVIACLNYQTVYLDLTPYEEPKVKPIQALGRKHRVKRLALFPLG